MDWQGPLGIALAIGFILGLFAVIKAIGYLAGAATEVAVQGAVDSVRSRREAHGKVTTRLSHQKASMALERGIPATALARGNPGVLHIEGGGQITFEISSTSVGSVVLLRAPAGSDPNAFSRAKGLVLAALRLDDDGATISA